MDQIDFKRLFTAFLFCMAIILAYQWYNAKYHPEPTAPVQSQEDSSAVDGSAQNGSSQTALLTAGGSWSLVIPQDTDNQVVTLGDLGESSPYHARVMFDPTTGAISQSLLNGFKLNVDDEQVGYPLMSVARPARGSESLSLMCGELRLQGRSERFDLTRACWVASGVTDDPCNGQSIQYTATIVDEENQPVLRIIKTYSYAPGDYELHFELSFDNQSSVPIQVESMQLYGPAGVMREDPRMDRRSVAVGYQSGEDFELQNVMMSKLNNESGANTVTVPTSPGYGLRWWAVSNKFFTAIVRPLPTVGQNYVNYINAADTNACWLSIADPARPGETLPSLGSMSVLSMDQVLPARGQVVYPFRIYMGPIDKDIFDKYYVAEHYEKLVPVSWCAFEWLTFALLGILKGIYRLVGNYGIAIIVLVLLVRLVMHPITKKSQISMMKMGKMGPLMQEIKEKYANNKEEMQRRTMELYKEQGVSPVLGCLPMLLQMPIWIALYTAVDTNVALRHKGLFPAAWHWLTDLSAPDRLIPFSWFGRETPFNIWPIGGVDAINLLPILLCVAMVLQQKFSPQSAMAKSNPQQASQQKMMMILMPVMMLVFLFTAPSGLNLYIMASTFAGLIEQHFIRKHIREQEALESKGAVAVTTKIGGRMEAKKRKPRPPQRYM
ncbi:MAG: YidC/Oxa1 family insertase periplasmic-domain containing protein [Sedimentisphaerales bacterium]|nr:YidC/Oxa1 family insertase periplasmic-domain containing protein [Sedimentisphaerales bacterium]